MGINADAQQRPAGCRVPAHLPLLRQASAEYQEGGEAV